jgi:branched-chain amino acid transport system substrate-binding protein
MKIGILQPRSIAHPSLGLDFADGLKAFLQQQRLQEEISLPTESTGFGGSEKEVYEKAERLLVVENVDVLVAFIDLKVKPILEPLLYASGKLLLVVNPGANYPQNWVPQPNMVHLTLHHAFLCWMSGSAAECSGAGVATTFYDGGYLHTAAMVKGFEQKGGSIRFNYVNQQPYNQTFDIKQLAAFLRTGQAAGLLCIMDTHPASLFYKLLNEEEVAEGLRLFVSPMMLQQKAWEAVPQGYRFSIQGYLPWYPSLQNRANEEFTAAFRQHTNRQVTDFALLGWETGLVLQQVFNQGKDHYTDGAAMAQALGTLSLDSPRGPLRLDRDTHYFVAPVYKAALPAASTEFQSEVVPDLRDKWTRFTREKTEGVVSGWTNTYLCY